MALDVLPAAARPGNNHGDGVQFCQSISSESTTWDRFARGIADPIAGLAQNYAHSYKAETDFLAFRADLERVHGKPGKSNAGVKPFDVVLMFRVLILPHLDHLSDAGIEYSMRDRLSCLRLLGLHLEDRVPDAKTVWLFREG